MVDPNNKKKKPRFFRRDWNKYVKLGKSVKKKRKWRAAKGGDSKVRLREKGYMKAPEIGWRNAKELRGKINGIEPVRVDSVAQLSTIKKGQGIIVAHVGKKRRNEIISKANEMKLAILNRYIKSKEAVK